MSGSRRGLLWVGLVVIAIGSVIFYLDLRVRSEGMDIEITATELFPDE